VTALRFVPAIVVGVLAVAPSCIDWQSGSEQRSSGGPSEGAPDEGREDVAQPAERASDWDEERGGAGGAHEPVEVGPHGGGGGEDGPVQLVGSGGSGGAVGSPGSSSSAASSSSVASSSASSGSGGGAMCVHALCQTGALLAAACDPCVAQICQQDPYCCQTGWDSVCVGEVGSICGAPCAAAPSGSCAHSICTIGGLLQPGCDPCVTAICQQDPYCCQTSWDGQCLNEVKTICGSAACG
jgi:hypothetical protein